MARTDTIGLADLQSRFLKKTKPGPGKCLVWDAAGKRESYGSFWLPKAYGGRQVGAHVASYILFQGEVPEGINVCHTCDAPRCVNPRHLWLGTQADNLADMMAKGRSGAPGLQGSAHPLAKLTEEDARAIRDAVGVKQSVLVEKYGVCQSVVSNIRSGKDWAHLA